jgi:hypothetical protein
MSYERRRPTPIYLLLLCLFYAWLFNVNALLLNQQRSKRNRAFEYGKAESSTIEQSGV